MCLKASITSTMCTAWHRSYSTKCCDRSLGVRHCSQSTYTHGLFYHFLFVTVEMGFLAIRDEAGWGGGGRRKINTSNVTCGQWNKGMIYVGMATPCIRWDLCLVSGRGEGRGCHRDPEKEEKVKKCSTPVSNGYTSLFSLLSLHHSSFSLCFHPSNPPCSLIVPILIPAVVL